MKYLMQVTLKEKVVCLSLAPEVQGHGAGIFWADSAVAGTGGEAQFPLPCRKPDGEAVVRLTLRTHSHGS